MSYTKRDTEENKFLAIVYDIYDKTIEQFKESISEESNDDKKKLKLIERLFKKEKDKSIMSEHNDLDLFIRSLRLTPPSFETLWDFCEFVRIAEKIFFFNNSPENSIFVEMDLNDPSQQRKIRIISGDEKKEIKFVLTHKILESDVIDIKVTRKYGLNMENVYRVINGEINYEDSSDLYLINGINGVLVGVMEDTIMKVVDVIKGVTPKR